MTHVGVLALQGSFAPHGKMFKKLGHEPKWVKKPEHLEGLTHLALPGGESTTFRWLMEHYGMVDALSKAFEKGLKLMGTCAGSILISRPNQESPPRLGLLDVEVKRNAYGRQVDSFTEELNIPCLGDRPFHGVFIRAPMFASIGDKIEVLGTWNDHPIVVRQGPILAMTFHPELTDDTRIHEYFLNEVQ